MSELVIGERSDDAGIQIDGDATVLDMPDAADSLVDHYRSFSVNTPQQEFVLKQHVGKFVLAS